MGEAKPGAERRSQSRACSRPGDHRSQSRETERASWYCSAAPCACQGTPRVYCAGERRRIRRPAMTAMPRTVDKAPGAETQAKLISETLAAFAHGLAPAAIP